MELRRLRLLHELAQRGTVAAVAEALSYSPSSVSVQLGELEREAGAVLLRRVGRRLEFTPAGRRLAAHAADALAADESVRHELTSISDSGAGRVRMTFVQTPALALLPFALHHLDRAAPGLVVELVQRETVPALTELRSHAVDLVVGVEYDPLPVPRQRSLHRQDLLREDVLIALPDTHPAAARRGPVRLADLEHAEWATGHRGTGIEALVRNVCNRLGGYEPDIRHRSDDGLLLGALVASGRAVAILPALVVDALPGVVARAVREEPLERTIFTVTRPGIAESNGIRAVREALLAAATSSPRNRKHLSVVG